MGDQVVVVTSIGIAYDTKLEIGPHHGKGRIGPPLIIQEEDIPEALRVQIRALAKEHAEAYWSR